jgi:thioredoxin 1
MSQIERATAIAVYEDLASKSEPVGVGSTEVEFVERLGAPDGVMSLGGKKRLKYSGGHAIVMGGKVTQIEGIPEERLSAPDMEAFITYQRALGKVEYQGRWMTVEESRTAYEKALQARTRELERIDKGRAETAKRAERIARQKPYTEIRRNGATITAQELIVPGMFTIVDFFADWCGPCRAIDPYLQDIAKNPRVVVRKVDIVNWGSPVARQWELKSIPNMRVYGPDGRQLGNPTSNLNQIVADINKSLEQ